MVDFGRIQKELKEIERDRNSGVTVYLKGSSLQRLTGTVEGPKDTPYENGYFLVDIQLDDQYPFVPPKMRFLTKVWHPNISSANGAICLDILKDQWSPALTLKTALLSLQALLSSPEPNDPQDAVVAGQYHQSYPEFARKARLWTGSAGWGDAFVGLFLTHGSECRVYEQKTYAHRAQMVSEDEKVVKLVEMGFDRDVVVRTLQTTNNDENTALELLLSGAA